MRGQRRFDHFDTSKSRDRATEVDDGREDGFENHQVSAGDESNERRCADCDAGFPVRYLLDVNVLLALAHTGHTLHSKALGWYASVVKSAVGFHTCSITELGFVRISVVTALQPDIESAKQALDALKSSSKVRFELVADDIGVSQLPSFVKKPQAVTDGHLFELARKNSLRLVTLDRGIPNSLFIG